MGKTHKRREIRLREHIEMAIEGRDTPIYKKISQIIATNRSPEIFVLARVPPDGSWQDEERRQIHFWRNFDEQKLPLIYPPQTLKSRNVEIKNIAIMNVRDGG